MTPVALAIVSAVGISAALLAGAGGAPCSTRVAAHRGGGLLWPENSLLAFRHAVALGVDALEFDLHLTDDGEVVVIHDVTLDRTTTGTGPVHDRSLNALASLRLRAREGRHADERIPTLAQVLDLAAPTRVELLPEIKVGRDRLLYEGIEEKVLGLLRARGLLGRSVIQAFQPETLRRVRALEPMVRRMLLVGRGQIQRTGGAPAAAVEWAREARATDLGMDHRLIDDRVVSAAQSSGIRLAAWTVNEETDLRRMLELCVDVVMSDRPDLALKLRGQ